jgi:preprotein translocase subunit SecD
MSAVLPSLCRADDPPKKPDGALVSDALKAKGGAAFAVKVLPAGDQPVTEKALEMSAGVVEKRINPFGGRSVTVKTKEPDRITVEVPGLTEKEAKALPALLEKKAELEFRVLSPEGLNFVPKEGTTEKPGYVKMKYRDDPGTEDRYLWVQDKVAIVGGTIRKAFHHLDPGARYYSLNITLQKEAGKIMEGVSSANIGKPIAIILDGEVLSAPTVNMTFGAHFMITGSFTEQQAFELASQLEHPLKNPLKVENSTFVPAPAAPSKP